MSDDLVKCLWKGVADVDQQQDAADRIEELEAENHLLKTSGIIDVAIRNPRVMGYLRHWEGRVEAAESKLAKVICLAGDMAEAIEDQIDICDASMEEQIAVKNYRAALAELKGQDDE